MSEKTALLVLNFGGPQHQGEVESFLFELFRDKDVIPLPGGSYLQEVFADVVSARRAPRIREQYAQIGGGSPLSAMTYQQVDALTAALKARGHAPEVHVGMRYTKPSIATALKAIQASGATRLVCLALYPHFSFATTGSSYNEVARAMKRLGLQGLPTTFIPAWYDHPEYIGALAEKVQAALEGTPEGTHILFSAHGLPVSFIKRSPSRPQRCVSVPSRARASSATAQSPPTAWNDCSLRRANGTSRAVSSMLSTWSYVSMKRRASSSRKPSSDSSPYSSAAMWMKFFMESVATTSVLSPSV